MYHYLHFLSIASYHGTALYLSVITEVDIVVHIDVGDLNAYACSNPSKSFEC